MIALNTLKTRGHKVYQTCFDITICIDMIHMKPLWHGQHWSILTEAVHLMMITGGKS